MEMQYKNMEEIFEDTHKSGKKIVWLAATMNDISLQIPKIIEFHTMLQDDWKTPSYLEEGIELLELKEYINCIICMELKGDQAVDLITEKGIFRAYNPTKLFELEPSNDIIWSLVPGNIVDEVTDLLSDIHKIKEIELVCAHEKYKKRTRGFFVQRIVEPYFFCMQNHLFYSQEKIKKEWEEVKKVISNDGLVVPNIGVEITTYCTLRCKHCVEYCPQIPKYNADAEQVIRWTSKALEAIDHLLYWHLITGECLLYPDLDKLLRFAIKEPKIRKVLILTNGMVMPKPEIMELLKNEKMYIQMSNYNQAIQMENLEKYRNAGIHIDFFAEQQWFSWGGDKKIYNRNRSVGKLKEVYANCRQGKSCPRIIIDGKLYNCGRIKRFELLGDYASVRDGFDLEKVNDSKVMREKILDNYLIDYLEGCDYCDFQDDDVTIIPAGEQWESVDRHEKK